MQRQQLERLQTELSTRKSTLHFAHTFVSGVITLIVMSAAMKLTWDAKQNYILAYIAFGIAFISLAYAILQYLSGRRALKFEHQRFAELQALRAELKLDDPSALLPKT